MLTFDTSEEAVAFAVKNGKFCRVCTHPKNYAEHFLEVSDQVHTCTRVMGLILLCLGCCTAQASSILIHYSLASLCSVTMFVVLLL